MSAVDVHNHSQLISLNAINFNKSEPDIVLSSSFLHILVRPQFKYGEKRKSLINIETLYADAFLFNWIYLRFDLFYFAPPTFYSLENEYVCVCEQLFSIKIKISVYFIRFVIVLCVIFI